MALKRTTRLAYLAESAPDPLSCPELAEILREHKPLLLVNDVPSIVCGHLNLGWPDNLGTVDIEEVCQCRPIFMHCRKRKLAKSARHFRYLSIPFLGSFVDDKHVCLDNFALACRNFMEVGRDAGQKVERGIVQRHEGKSLRDFYPNFMSSERVTRFRTGFHAGTRAT